MEPRVQPPQVPERDVQRGFHPQRPEEVFLLPRRPELPRQLLSLVVPELPLGGCFERATVVGYHEREFEEGHLGEVQGPQEPQFVHGQAGPAQGFFELLLEPLFLGAFLRARGEHQEAVEAKVFELLDRHGPEVHPAV